MATMWWVRRDLRTVDNEALRAARHGGGTALVVFCEDPAFLDGTARAGALGEALTNLEAAVGPVYRITGRPETVIPAFAAEHDVHEVHVSGEYGPYGRERDVRTAAALRAQGIDLVVSGSNYLVAPGTITNGAGTQMRTFRGFKQAWFRNAQQSMYSFGGDVQGGLSLELLERWLPSSAAYPEGREYPARDATTGLSVDLRFGMIHPGRIVATVAGHPGGERLVEQLCWREWYADNLWHDRGAAWRAADVNAPIVACDTDVAARARFAAWAEGRTGYAIVDAGMRQLLATGWMHNRVRMVTASFLVKHLHLPWQWGARHFLRHLSDGDLASNNLSWQWVAGCGIDAAPFFRIFNPSTQGERFDPDGEYVRRWVPELECTPTRHLHLPGCDGTYLPPVVDHHHARHEALRRWRAAREG